jgi:hypothetical protein
MHFVFNGIRYIFAKYNKNYQNVNGKRLQLTTYFLTLNGHLALFLILTRDMDIQSSMPWTRPQRATRDYTIVVPAKYWIIISLFRFF